MIGSSIPDALAALVVLALLGPALGFVTLGAAIALHVPLSERAMARWTMGALVTSWLASAATIAFLVFDASGATVVVDLGSWVHVRGYELHSVLFLDAASAVFLGLTATLLSLVASYSARYLHREPGFARFFLLLLLFSTGLVALTVGGSMDIFLGGWELVALSSTLLIAFFHHRADPVRHGLRAFAVYRVCDVGLLVGIVLLHEVVGTTVFSEMFDDLASRGSQLELEGIALLFVLAAMGKSAMLPFTGWLPRAMEGPTPSSAIFYGALSIHAGPFLLMRLAPLFALTPVARGVVFAAGAITALHGMSVGRAQTDIKSKLAYASVSQVSLIWIEVSLGLETLALVHMVAHASLRTWELLRAPSFLHEHRHHVGEPRDIELRWLPPAWRTWIHRVSLERWYLDDAMGRLANAVKHGLLRLDALDRGFVEAVAREPEIPAEGAHHEHA